MCKKRKVGKVEEGIRMKDGLIRKGGKKEEGVRMKDG